MTIWKAVYAATLLSVTACEFDEFPEEENDLPYQVIAGWAVIDDMILGPADDFSGDVLLSAINTRAWPYGRIPYKINNNLSLFAKQSINHAIGVWNATGIVSIVPAKSSDGSVVEFLPPTEEMNFGLTEGLAQVGYDADDPIREVYIGGWMGPSGVTHEIGHVVGLKHEQQRRDRDEFVDINIDNVREGKEGNFAMFGTQSHLQEFGAYDFNSIMHYNSYSFAEDTSIATIVKKGCSFTDPEPECVISRDSEPTAGDVRGVIRVMAGPSERFKNDANDLCLRPSGGSWSSGTKIVTSSCTNTRSRRWFTYERKGGGVWLVNENSRKCLTVPTAWSGSNHVKQQPCDNLSTQLFDIVPNGSGVQIRQRGTNRCLRRISSTSTVILSTSCTSSSSRRWLAP